MVRLLHTADWQIGHRAPEVPDVAARVREARLEAARAVVALANGHGADALVLAGDTFEDHFVEERLVTQVLEILDASTAPVFVLPGNHDALTQGCLYRRAPWTRGPAKITLLQDLDPVPIPGTDAVLLAAPLKSKKGFTDPTRDLRRPSDGGADRIAIGVAHGGWNDGRLKSADSFPIAPDVCERAGLDYLALGDIHKTQTLTPRAAYAGSHEVCRFGEESGNALLVTIDAPQATPRIESFRTGQLTWLDPAVDLTAGVEAACDIAHRIVDGIPAEARPNTLLKLIATGQSGDGATAQLQALEAELSGRLLYVRIERRDIPAALAQGRLKAAADSSPLVAGLLEELARQGQVEDPAMLLAARNARDLLATLVLETFR